MLKFRRSGLKTETIVPDGEHGKGSADVVNNNRVSSGSNNNRSSSGSNSSAANVNEHHQHLDNRRTSGDGKTSRFGYNVNKPMNELAMSQKVMYSLVF